MIVDCHTHWAPRYHAQAGSDPAQWFAVLQKHGVTHAVVLPMVGLCDDTVLEQDNDDVAAACSASAGRMIPFATVNPWSGEAAVAEFRRCLETLHVRGLKFHPWLQGISPNTEEMDRLSDMAGASGVPVLFHDGTPPFSLPSQIALLARRHPHTRFVLGHCGLLEHWREAIAAMHHAENLWGCLCSPHLAGLSEIVRRSDRDRLVWGSDHGFSLADAVGYRKGLLELTGLADADREAIFSRNPARLLGLDG
ncbi:MAG: amidohydrolase family protein [Planctomycetota bacterium]